MSDNLSTFLPNKQGGMYNWQRMRWQWGYNGKDMKYQSFSQMRPG